jgi:hypothetical protein
MYTDEDANAACMCINIAEAAGRQTTATIVSRQTVSSPVLWVSI